MYFITAGFIFHQVLYNILFKPNLSSHKGTLPQLKALINCTANINPTKNMKGCEDFLQTVLHAHIICAAKNIMSKSRFDNVINLAKEIVVQYLSFDPDVKVTCKDKVKLYALQVLNLGLLWHAFNDAVKEGDGDRILTYYKFFLLVFKAGKCYNYCKEAINLLLQYHFLFTERQAHQLKWCRCINTQGKPGSNISCDLHIEHLNRRLKGMIHNIHSKKPDNSINRVAKSIGVINQVCEIFEEENEVTKQSNKHSRPSFSKELEMMTQELEENQIFESLDRNPTSYRNIKSVLQSCSTNELKAWIPKKVKKYQL